jgi:hypothetical protein
MVMVEQLVVVKQLAAELSALVVELVTLAPAALTCLRASPCN